MALIGVNAVLVRIYYRGPGMQTLAKAERDVCLISGGQVQEEEMRRLHINAGELTAKAHERGLDSLDEVETAVLYPNGTIYFQQKPAMAESTRFDQIMHRLDDIGAQVAALRRQA